jgi:hypothetical protein
MTEFHTEGEHGPIGGDCGSHSVVLGIPLQPPKP